MTKTFKATLAAVLLASVAAAPLATLTVFATTDAAYAKSDKAGGNGKAGLKGQSNGKSGNRSASSGGGKSNSKKFGSTVEGLFQKLTGQEKKSSGAASGKFAGGLHPSQLGNMNGALHANENAILAHIRNGNTNGPVGMMAALAVANYNASATAGLLDGNLAQEYAALDELAQSEGYENYQAYLDSGDVNTILDDAAAGIGQQDFDEALAGTPYADYDAYLLEAYGDGSPEHPGDPLLIDPELEALHDNIGAYDPTKSEEFAQAEADAQAYEDAMGAMLDYWNKGDADSENADALREALEARLAEYQGVGDAVDAMEAETTSAATTTGTEGCDIEDPECVPDAEVATITE